MTETMDQTPGIQDLGVGPGRVEAADRYNDLIRAPQSLEAPGHVIRAELVQMRGSGISLKAQAEALLAGKGRWASDQETGDLQKELFALDPRMAWLRKAIAFESGILRLARAESRGRIFLEVRPHYQQVPLRLARKVIEFGHALEDEVRVRADLGSKIDFGVLPPGPFSAAESQPDLIGAGEIPDGRREACRRG